MMDTSILEDQIKSLRDEQEKVQLAIIHDIQRIELIQQTKKFRGKRLRDIEKELAFWERELSKVNECPQ